MLLIKDYVVYSSFFNFFTDKKNEIKIEWIVRSIIKYYQYVSSPTKVRYSL